MRSWWKYPSCGPWAQKGIFTKWVSICTTLYAPLERKLLDRAPPNSEQRYRFTQTPEYSVKEGKWSRRPKIGMGAWGRWSYSYVSLFISIFLTIIIKGVTYITIPPYEACKKCVASSWYHLLFLLFWQIRAYFSLL